MDVIISYLPKHSGILPCFLLVLSVVSIGNSVQAYSTTFYSKRIYIGPPAPPDSAPPKESELTRGFDLTRSPATALSARTFGTWTFLASIVRLYAAYNIHHPAIYQLAMWTFGVAFAHFGLEWFWFKTTRWGAPLAGPALVSTTGLIWMFLQWGHYVK